MTPLPEIVAPGGNLEKLQIAFAFGADAVYVGGTEFGLRKSADNFTLSELHSAVELANTMQKKVFLVLNGFAHSADIEKLPSYLKEIELIQPHALIISDMGVLRVAKENSSIPIHTSTQASVTNWRTAKMWKDAGAKRVVVARELSLEEAALIQDKAQIEVEIFVHGAMCSSYSGKCTISNYTSGRDSNRGGCVQSCRHAFEIENEHAYIMNSKDLMALELIPKIKSLGLSSLKIEGRMKSNLYVANAVSQYRAALDTFLETPIELENRAARVSNRGFNTGSLIHNAGKESLSSDWNGYSKQLEFVGTVKQNGSRSYVSLKNPVQMGDSLLLMHPNGSEETIEINALWDSQGERIDAAFAGRLIQIELPPQTTKNSLLARMMT